MKSTSSRTAETMKAMQLTFDKQAKLIDVPKPVPRENEILVKVVASALDTATEQVLSKSWSGKFIHASTANRPLILGWHYAGTVVELGGQVASQYQIGSEVWGHLAYEPFQTQGTFAEYITVAPEECAIKPKSVTFRQAAAASVEAMTALQAMREYGGLEKDMGILLVGAGGGVGSMAVGIAKRLGAHVTAVCGTKDVNRVKLLGADIVLDRSKGEDPFLNRNQYLVIFDTPNVYSPRACLNSLKPGGTYVATLPSWGLLWGFLASMFTSKKVTMIECKSKKKDLELVGEWLEKDSLSVQIDSYYKVAELQEALGRQCDGSKTGRVVLDVQDGWE